jgi:hypothetical protein
MSTPKDAPTPPNPAQPRPHSIPLDIPEAVAEGIYANAAYIQHSPSELVIDFIRLLPNTPRGRVFSRIVMTPHNAKSFLLALDENLKRYESTYGPLKVGAGDSRSIGF